VVPEQSCGYDERTSTVADADGEDW
jgi:hypothetical protein